MTEKTTPLMTLTPEQREEVRSKALAARREKVEASKSWKHDWKDAPLWKHLCKEAGMKSTPSFIHCSELKYVKRVLKVIGKDIWWWKEHFYETGGLITFSKQNPNVPMYALQGLMLEAFYSTEHPSLIHEFRNTEQGIKNS